MGAGTTSHHTCAQPGLHLIRLETPGCVQVPPTYVTLQIWTLGFSGFSSRASARDRKQDCGIPGGRYCQASRHLPVVSGPSGATSVPTQSLPDLTHLEMALAQMGSPLRGPGWSSGSMWGAECLLCGFFGEASDVLQQAPRRCWAFHTAPGLPYPRGLCPSWTRGPPFLPGFRLPSTAGLPWLCGRSLV